MVAKHVRVQDIVDTLRHPTSHVTVFVPTNYTCTQVILPVLLSLPNKTWYAVRRASW